MGVVCVHRWKGAVNVDTAQQKVAGTLVFPGLTTFTLDPTVTWTAGTWSLIAYTTFDYVGSGPPGYASGQACLDALVNVVVTGTGRTFVALTDDTTNSRVTVTLA
jgi:hypothetical protein